MVKTSDCRPFAKGSSGLETVLAVLRFGAEGPREGSMKGRIAISVDGLVSYKKNAIGSSESSFTPAILLWNWLSRSPSWRS